MLTLAWVQYVHFIQSTLSNWYFSSLLGDYMQNRCHAKNTTALCKPCEDRFISCVNKPNGRNSVVGDAYSYVICLQNRTIDKVECTEGYFFHTLVKECIPLRFFGKFFKMTRRMGVHVQDYFFQQGDKLFIFKIYHK